MTIAAIIAVIITAQQHQFDCKKVSQNKDGSWKVVEPFTVTTETLSVRLFPGITIEKENDLVKLLEQMCGRKS